MSLSTRVCFTLFVAGVVLALLQLWFHVWYSETFFKIIFTLGAIFAVSFVWAFLVRENKASKKIDSGNSGLD